MAYQATVRERNYKLEENVEVDKKQINKKSKKDRLFYNRIGVSKMEIEGITFDLESCLAGKSLKTSGGSGDELIANPFLEKYFNALNLPTKHHGLKFEITSDLIQFITIFKEPETGKMNSGLYYAIQLENGLLPKPDGDASESVCKKYADDVELLYILTDNFKIIYNQAMKLMVKISSNLSTPENYKFSKSTNNPLFDLTAYIYVLSKILGEPFDQDCPVARTMLLTQNVSPFYWISFLSKTNIIDPKLVKFFNDDNEYKLETNELKFKNPKNQKLDDKSTDDKDKDNSKTPIMITTIKLRDYMGIGYKYKLEPLFGLNNNQVSSIHENMCEMTLHRKGNK